MFSHDTCARTRVMREYAATPKSSPIEPKETYYRAKRDLSQTREYAPTHERTCAPQTKHHILCIQHKAPNKADAKYTNCFTCNVWCVVKRQLLPLISYIYTYIYMYTHRRSTCAHRRAECITIYIYIYILLYMVFGLKKMG